MRPICIDLDGTLIKSDLSFELLIKLLLSNPLQVFSIVPLLRNKGELKAYLAERFDISPEHLPYNEAVLQFLRENRDRPQILVTGSHEKFAKIIAKHLELDDWAGSNASINLTGKRKSEFLCDKFGERNFDYLGNSSVDIPVWEKSYQAVSVVDGDWKLANLIVLSVKKENFFKIFLKMLRVHQWSKNVLVFLPVLLAFQTNIATFKEAFFAFFSFCFIASSVYILNDIIDIDNDRKHPSKKKRPIPAAQIQLHHAFLIMILLLCSSMILSSFIANRYAFLFPLGYFLLNILYSTVLKKMLVVDLVVLTSFYIIRIFYGGFATQTPVSYWLINFSFFVFFSLAVIKRYTEVVKIFKKQGIKEVAGRAYNFDDAPVLLSLGVGSGVASTLVLSLYFKFGIDQSIYRNQNFLWVIEGLMLLWISNIWLRTHRGKVDDDPVKFAMTDSFSLAVFLLILVSALKAIW